MIDFEKLPKFPVCECLDQLGKALDEQNKVVLIAPPGAGKTTLVPLSLLNANWLKDQKIVVLEPRRLAARSAAVFMASLIGETVGQTIGYRVRSDTRVSKNTRIELVTEGVFTRMLLSDPELSEVGAVLFDEFHERNLDGDLGLALALDVQSELREDLRILPMSATLDGAKVSSLLDSAPLVESPGRGFPVEIRYQPRPASEKIETSMARAIQNALVQHEGSILAFLPGKKEVHNTLDLIESRLPSNAYAVPLYGALDGQQQDEAIKPAGIGQRKIVVATSIAETSLTIDGIRVVIDSGLSRVPRYEPSTGLTRLETVRASLSSVDQRAGRAGRTRPGTAIRLWHEGQMGALSANDRPEILEADLTGLVLALASWGVYKPEKLTWSDPPPATAWQEASSTLCNLGALNPDGSITEKGNRILASGVNPHMANMLYEAARLGVGERAALLATVLEERGLGGSSDDVSLRLNRFVEDNSSRAQKLKRRARQTAKVFNQCSPSIKRMPSVSALLSLAYPGRIAQARGQKGNFRLANGRGAYVSDDSTFTEASLLVATDLQGSASGVRILSAAKMTMEELETFHGHRIFENRTVFFDLKDKRVKALKQKNLDNLVFSSSPDGLLAEDNPSAILVKAIKTEGVDLIDWSGAAKSLRDRVEFLSGVSPEKWPDLSAGKLTETVSEWLEPYLGKTSAVADIESELLFGALKTLVGYEKLAEIDQRAPTHFLAPSGSKVPIRYTKQEAVLQIRVQELFGLKEHPMVGDKPLLLELLSPAHRPIQKTADLPGFWSGSWNDVRSELRGRYPKHYWPENPAEAQATAKAKPRKTKT